MGSFAVRPGRVLKKIHRVITRSRRRMSEGKAASCQRADQPAGPYMSAYESHYKNSSSRIDRANSAGMPASFSPLKRLWYVPSRSLACFALILLSGCHGSASTIAIQILPAAAQSLDVGQSISFSAVVGGDTANTGVTWQLGATTSPGVGTGCSNPAGTPNTGTAAGNCGSLSSATAFSVTYTAPTSISSAISIILTATSKTTTSVTTTTTIS